MTMKPALTAEEWFAYDRVIGAPGIQWTANNRNFWVLTSDQERPPGDYALSIGAEVDGKAAHQVPRDKQHGVAALALYGQPFGFTRADVDFLREQVHNYESGDWGFGLSAEIAAANSLADRIEALLPPEG